MYFAFEQLSVQTVCVRAYDYAKNDEPISTLCIDVQLCSFAPPAIAFGAAAAFLLVSCSIFHISLIHSYFPVIHSKTKLKDIILDISIKRSKQFFLLNSSFHQFNRFDCVSITIPLLSFVFPVNNMCTLIHLVELSCRLHWLMAFFDKQFVWLS